MEIAIRNRETAAALEEFARIRLDAGQGSRLNHVRSSQELATGEAAVEAQRFRVRQAQEALGVAIFADAPVDAAEDPSSPCPRSRPRTTPGCWSGPTSASSRRRRRPPSGWRTTSGSRGCPARPRSSRRGT